MICRARGRRETRMENGKWRKAQITPSTIRVRRSSPFARRGNYGSVIVCPACTRLGSIFGLAAAMVFHLLPLPYFACAIDQSDSPLRTLYLVPPLGVLRRGRDLVTGATESDASTSGSSFTGSWAAESCPTGCGGGSGENVAGGAGGGAGVTGPFIAAWLIGGTADAFAAFLFALL